MNEDNKSIKCDVIDCKYNDDSTLYCTLNEIKVSSNKNNCDTCSKKETICDSFKQRKNS